jgi:hypothetical protein
MRGDTKIIIQPTPLLPEGVGAFLLHHRVIAIRPLKAALDDLTFDAVMVNPRDYDDLELTVRDQQPDA